MWCFTNFIRSRFNYAILHFCKNSNIVTVLCLYLFSDCGSEFNVYPPIFGMSYTPRPISNKCMQKAKYIIRSFGFPDRAYNTYPMRLSTRCIFWQPFIRRLSTFIMSVCINITVYFFVWMNNLFKRCVVL